MGLSAKVLQNQEETVFFNGFLDGVICDIASYADDTVIVYSKCDQASDLRQQLELGSEHESDVCKTLWTVVRSGLLISMLEKLN